MRKWTEAYKSGWWNGYILQANQLRKSLAIEAKLSQLGREETLSLKNDILRGYLSGLGRAKLYKLLRKPLQHMLNDHMVRKRGWEPTDNVKDIERPTKRRCLRRPRNTSTGSPKNLQGKAQNQDSVGLPKVKTKQQNQIVLHAFTKNKPRTTLHVSRPPRRSKRLREKASGYILDGVSRQNEASLCVPKKKKKKNYSGEKISPDKELTRVPVPTIAQLIATG